ncbi:MULTISPECIES: helix-turn-helix transcriptional regulator [Robertmurraya]|uniref:Metalloregulator ArsR/SmtB family transcription factor n=1 Tax=Robertmurraya beringensis TaxID=641660 RepID=A0ABV6KT36_9BACI
MSKNTREHILDLLKKEVSLAVNELTERLHITHMAVRKHLTILEKDHLIQSIEVKQPLGRPLQMYSLTEKGEQLFPKNYESISVEFLRDIQELHGEETIQLLFDKREKRITDEYKLKVQEKKNLSEKIKELATLQNDKGYMTEVNQVDEHSYEMIEYNCPIYAVAKEFMIACRCETDMFKNVVGTKQVDRICCKTDGDDHCRFVFRE